MSSAAPASTITFGGTLKFLRKRAHLTQRELGIAVGYSETQITRLENDTRVPDPVIVRARFVEALGIEREPHLSQQLIDLAVLARTTDRRPAPAALEPNSNLTPALTRFIGRQSELQHVIELIKSHRLVTLTGAGGVGKTRLAIEAGMHLLDHFADGVQAAELAPIGDATLIAQHVAGVFKITNQSGHTHIDALRVMLAGKHLLLILDNCEHVIHECALLADGLLHNCPTLHILATSREALNIPGELAWRVPSMNPAEAANLFEERALAAKTDFMINEGNAGDVTAICTRLDGIPLAIELAASRLNALSVHQLASRLDDRFNLLTNGSRTALQRHQTLRALIAWSYDLLSNQERTLLRRLAVFAGGCTAEAAEAVCATPRDHADDMALLYAPNVLPLLLGLVNKSLVITSDEGEHTRYTMLETIRQFLDDHLKSNGEKEWAHRQHFTYFLNLAETTEPRPQLHVSAGRSKATLDRMQEDIDNFRAAQKWVMDEGETDLALRLCLAMCPLWEARGFWTEGRQTLQRVLSRIDEDHLTPAQTERYAQALMQSAILAWRQSDYQTARRNFNESLVRSRKCGDLLSAGSALSYLGGVSFEQGDYASAREFYEQALAVWEALPEPPSLSCSLTRLAIANAMLNQGDLESARQLGEEQLVFHRQHDEQYSLSYALNLLGTISFMQGDALAARPFYEESLGLRRQLGNKRGIAATANVMGDLHAALGQLQEALALYVESLHIYQDLGNRRGMASAMSGLARLHLLQGDLHQAAILLTVVERTLGELGASLDEPIRSANELAREHIRNLLNPASLADVMHASAFLPFEQAIRLALADDIVECL